MPKHIVHTLAESSALYKHSRDKDGSSILIIWVHGPEPQGYGLRRWGLKVIGLKE